MKKVVKNILQYAGALLLAIVIAALLRFFIVDFYSIPSDSMYPTIEPGDFIVVNKLYMGARFYKNLDFLEGARPETVRVPGYSALKRNDVIVFNFPKYNQDGEWELDPQTFYVKRCVALPGDTLSIVDGINIVNGKSGYGNLQDQQRLHQYRGDYARGIFHAFPFDTRHGWSIRDFGPLYIPAAGSTISIDTSNYPLYHTIISHETRKPIRIRRGEIYLGDSLIRQYTFRKNWYFICGDKVFDSRDSRYLGPIPEDFIVGKASFVLTSKDPYTKDYVWRRFFKKIK